MALRPIHQDLPPDVEPYPTLKGKRKFEVLQAFNAVLALYILAHQLLVPVAVYWLQTSAQSPRLELGFWYWYHFALAILLWTPFRQPKRLYWVVFLCWFALGYLPLTLASGFWDQGQLRFQWKTLSGVLCYGTSLLWTSFMLYRLRMPTTAFLFGCPDRLIPKLRYALPYFLIGVAGSILWVGSVKDWFNTAGADANPLKTVPAIRKQGMYE